MAPLHCSNSVLALSFSLEAFSDLPTIGSGVLRLRHSPLRSKCLAGLRFLSPQANSSWGMAKPALSASAIALLAVVAAAPVHTHCIQRRCPGDGASSRRSLASALRQASSCLCRRASSTASRGEESVGPLACQRRSCLALAADRSLHLAGCSLLLLVEASLTAFLCASTSRLRPLLYLQPSRPATAPLLANPYVLVLRRLWTSSGSFLHDLPSCLSRLEPVLGLSCLHSSLLLAAA